MRSNWPEPPSIASESPPFEDIILSNDSFFLEICIRCSPRESAILGFRFQRIAPASKIAPHGISNFLEAESVDYVARGNSVGFDKAWSQDFTLRIKHWKPL
jgi:hypothetical protein